jgi:hypothetical protein
MTRTSREHVWWVWKRENLSIALFALLLAMTPAMSTAHGFLPTPEPGDENNGFSLTSGTGFTPWSFGIVPYAIDSSIPADIRQRIDTAIQIWEQQTPIRFITTDDAPSIMGGVTPTHSVLFIYTSKDVCVTVGGIGNLQHTGQQISLGPKCTLGNILHEMGHKLGAEHEQLNPNAATGITFRMDRVQDTKEDQYAFPPSSTTTATAPPTTGTQETVYDTGSIMHYGPYAFTVCGNPLEPKWSKPGAVGTASSEYKACSVANWGAVTTPVNCLNWCAVMVDTTNQKPIQAGQRKRLSPLDIEGFGKMYEQARDIDNIYRTVAFRPATANELFTDGTALQAGKSSLAQITEEVRAAQPQEVLMSLRTRRGTYFNAYDGYPLKPGHPAPSMTCRDGLSTLPGHG